jgi:AcrR family transcriptional regulator
MDRAPSKRPRGSKKIGRPSKLTQEVEVRLLQALSLGAYRQTAAKYAGISRSTLYRWFDHGEADIEAGIKSDVRKFVERANKTEAEAELRLLAYINVAAPTNWRAAAWKLERKHPYQWGRRGERAVITNASDFYEEYERAQERLEVLTDMGLDHGWIRSVSGIMRRSDETDEQALDRIRVELKELQVTDQKQLNEGDPSSDWRDAA